MFSHTLVSFLFWGNRKSVHGGKTGKQNRENELLSHYEQKKNESRLHEKNSSDKSKEITPRNVHPAFSCVGLWPMACSNVDERKET